MNQYLLPTLTVAAFTHSVAFPGWYTVIEFIAALSALISQGYLTPAEQSNITAEEFEMMKKAVDNLGGQLKTTSNKLNAFLMQSGYSKRINPGG